jgi:thiamine pyrophosphate-dependent acetolactate synthase large subunit-like protein
MDRAEKAKILEGIAKVSAIFRNMSVASKAIRDPSASYPERLRDAFTVLAKGHPLPTTAGINADWQRNPQFGDLYKAAIDINGALESIKADEILESGPDDLKRLVGNPASYTPPKPRQPGGSRFPIYD